MLTLISSFVVVLFTSSYSLAAIQGQAKGQVTEFRSPKGRTEVCIQLDPMPGAVYKKKDAEQQQFFCSIDLHGLTTAMCPKTNSTSPGTLFFSTEGTGLTPAQYEARMCSERGQQIKLGKFKSTMNTPLTSGTYSPSSLLYFHFSRYFDTSVDVPVSVYRTIDKDVHFERVSSRAVGRHKMNVAGWEKMREAEQNPSAYKPIDDLFTADREQIYGAILRDKGEPYGAEVNGTRVSGWGTGQNNDFQKTPGFLALRSEQSLKEAIVSGTAAAIKDEAMKTALGPGVSSMQIVYWMKEITEITLLDYIFSQQDRVGNIDFEWHWIYSQNGEVKSQKVKDDRYQDLPRRKMASIPVPAEIASLNPTLVQRSLIVDNDAGGRTKYANFTKTTQMLEKIRHYNLDTYRRLLSLNDDIAAKGPLYGYLSSTFGVTENEVAMIANNVKAATAILRETCRAGKLRFDLSPKAFILGQQTEVKADCDRP